MPLPTYIQLPKPPATMSTPSRADINAAATSPAETQASVAAENAPLRVIYGRPRLGGDPANVLVYQGKWLIQVVWGEGEIDAIESVTLGDKELPAGVTATHYLGTAGQTVDPTMVAAFAAVGITYIDALPGIAYSVFLVPADAFEGYPSFAAIVRGRKVYDPRSGLTAWSDCPSLCLADFITNATFGLDRDVDWASVADAADANDELVEGVRRRILGGLVIESVARTRQHVEAMRAYAGCLLDDTGTYKFIPERPRATDHTLTATDVLEGSLKLRKRGILDVPTVIEVRYTDTQTIPWAEKSAFVYAPGVLEGTTPRREAQINLPALHTYAQAYREGVERLNHQTLEDLDAEWIGFDEALAIESGDVASLTHPIGLTAKLFRIVSAKPVEPGRYRIMAREYDPAAYSDVVQAEPTFADTTMPSPAEPPALLNLLAVEEVFQMENGLYSSRIKATWTPADYPYLRDYRIEIYQAGKLVATSTTREAIYRTGAVQEGVEYVVQVAAVTSIGAVGEWAQYNVTPQGKSLIPGDVPSASVFEAGGRVYASWLPAVDIDIWRYEARYSPVGGSWASATLIDRVDALRLISDQIPVGTWTFYVKAIDSVGQYSANAATATCVVTSDASAFLVDSYESDTPTLTNMEAFTLNRYDGVTHYITEDNVPFGTKFPNALGTYTEPLASYHASITSTWLGEAEDFGQLLSGQWTGDAVVTDVSGSHASSMGFSVDGSAYEYQIGLSHKVNARFARIKHEALTASTMRVKVPGQTIRLDAVPREEVGTGVSSAAGPVTVKLENNYVAVKDISITPMGSTARSGVVDNIVVGPAVLNADFEAATLEDWALVEGSGTCSRTTSIVHDGAAAMLFDSTTELCAYGCRAIPVTPGKVIKLRAWVYSSAAVASGFYFRLNQKDTYPDGGYVTHPIRSGLTEIFSNAPLVAGWQLKEGSYTVPAGVYWVSISFYHWTGMSGATLVVDSVEFDNNAFDAYVFDSAGTKIASDFSYKFNGV